MIVPRLKRLFLLIALFHIGGCHLSEKEDVTAAKKRLTVGVVYDIGGLGDQAFNDGVAAGIAMAKSNLDISVYPIESRNANEYESHFQSLFEQGVDLIVSVGITQRSALEKFAKSHPAAKFIYVDAYLDLPNVCSLTFKEHEGSFLAGYAAALTSKADKIGFVGAMDIPLINKFYIGYHAGAIYAKKSTSVLPPKYSGSWDNVDRAMLAANLLYDKGVDIVYQVAGRSGLGVLRAASERKKYAIGVDNDQDGIYPGAVLFSMVKHVDQAVFQTLSNFVNQGEKFKFEKKVYGLKEGVLGLSNMKFTRQVIGQRTIDKVNNIKQSIIEGKIFVPQTFGDLKKFAHDVPVRDQ